MYTQSITRAHRTAFIFLIDGSGSMAESTLFRGRPATKAEAVAAVTNELLFELIERARRDGGVRNYYDIAVLGYSGDNEVQGLLPGGAKILSVEELAARPTPMRTEVIEHRLPNGEIALREIPTPAWIAPRAAGQTPMYQAIIEAQELLAEWTSHIQHAESFPPIVFNITDGEATDCNDEELLSAAERIRSLHTANGHVLLINIHITADQSGHTVFFPSDDEASCPNRHAGVLYNCSSPMPELFDEAIRAAKGPGAMPPFRGMSFNASASEMIAILNIGSISVKTE